VWIKTAQINSLCLRSEYRNRESFVKLAIYISHITKLNMVNGIYVCVCVCVCVCVTEKQRLKLNENWGYISLERVRILINPKKKFQCATRYQILSLSTETKKADERTNTTSQLCIRFMQCKQRTHKVNYGHYVSERYKTLIMVGLIDLRHLSHILRLQNWWPSVRLKRYYVSFETYSGDISSPGLLGCDAV